MKLFICISIIILLSFNSNAQQNYFSTRLHYGCSQSGFSVLQHGNNFDVISTASCLGIGFKNIFIRVDSLGNEVFHKPHGVDWFNYYTGGYSGLVRQEDSTYIFAGSVQDSLNQGDAILYKLSK